MKLCLLSATLFFFLFLVFFARRFPTYNWFFAAWLLLGIASECSFALLLAFDLRPVPYGAGLCARIPGLAIQVAGWLLIGLAALAAARRQDAVNQTILSGLGALILLQLVAMAAARVPVGPPNLRALASNLAGLLPTVYMLAAFSGARLDSLPLLTADCRLKIADWRAAVGFARALLG